MKQVDRVKVENHWVYRRQTGKSIITQCDLKGEAQSVTECKEWRKSVTGEFEKAPLLTGILKEEEELQMVIKHLYTG